DDLYFLEIFLERHPERDRLLERLRARVGSIAELDCTLPPGSTLDEGLVLTSSGPRPPGVSGRCWLMSEPEAKGRGEIALGRLEHETLRFALGGTRSTGIRVELHIEGRVVESASPETQRELSPIVWDIGAHRGKEATLVVLDDDAAGGVLLDGIHGGVDPESEIAEARSLPARELAARLRWLLPELGRARLEPLLQERKVRRFSFDEASYPAEAIVSGDAFGEGPANGALPGQTPVTGHFGGLINTFRSSDAATGRLEIPLEGFEGGTISFLVGGGRHCGATYVGIEANGARIGRSCGAEAEALRPASIRVPRLPPGTAVSFVVEDRSTESWGHILVDDVIVVPDAPPATPPRDSSSPTPGAAAGPS
ncbi:MAG: hypothetical protein H5U40_14330, partial [Polyangiaceae bacterium]|nr:hypothetical protein [Polyangiaceae bacterium]